MSVTADIAVEAAPVVLLHGWGGSSRGTWGASALPARLAASGRIPVVVDLPGHGPAEASHASEDYDAIVAMVEGSLPEGRLDLIGFSLGAKIALMIALEHPERVARLVLAGVGDNVFSAEPGGEAVRAAMTVGIGPEVPTHVRGAAVYALQSGGDPHAIGACLCRRWEPPTVEMLAQLDAPVLLAYGDQDTVIRSTEELRAALPGADVHVLTGIDHHSTPYSIELHDLVAQFLSHPSYTSQES